MQVTIGGDRVGSGRKMKGTIKNYNRSTHNLSEKFTSSVASGILYPSMIKPAMRGDSFDIDIQADLRSIPTQTPLFGSYKLQTDVYQIPWRLYQGILHNNPLAIGLQMSKVLLPKLELESWAMQVRETLEENQQYDMESGKTHESSLLNYLGFKGIGSKFMAESDMPLQMKRKILAIPALAYYDIYKTYYANKQEEVGYVIDGANDQKQINLITNPPEYSDNRNYRLDINNVSFADNELKHVYLHVNNTPENFDIIFETPEEIPHWYIMFNTEIVFTYLRNNVINDTSNMLFDYMNNYPEYIKYSKEGNKIRFNISNPKALIEEDTETEVQSIISISFWVYGNKGETEPKLRKFNLQNIDDMRYKLLSKNSLGYQFIIDDTEQADWNDKSGKDNTGLPYSSLIGINKKFYGDTPKGLTKNSLPLQGLVIKTYQNDIFNNWLNTEWIEGENGINELTSVEIVNGKFSMDALNFAQKLYQMLNRIAIAGATYEDWQDVVYEEVKRKQIESPIFLGGMSQEVVFDEIIQTTPTDDSALGTLGGRGRLMGNQKGGHIHVKCDEACFIIAITSLTPRINYTQGNEFFMTELDSLDDLHKPQMDGIGFQDLVGERLAWFDTHDDSSIQPDGKFTEEKYTQHKIGKLPAWIEYMTSVDKAYGDFAKEYGKSTMTLNRNYERNLTNGVIKDPTTYVDPSKYNYAFATQMLSSQNFWLQIKFDITARRLMSARIIPNV